MRKIFECELDGPSVIVWEGGSGTRIVYPTEQSAEIAANWLIGRANAFHTAKERNDGDEDEVMVAVICYGDQPMSEFQFIRNYLDRMRRQGFEVINGLTRDTKEFW